MPKIEPTDGFDTDKKTEEVESEATQKSGVEEASGNREATTSEKVVEGEQYAVVEHTEESLEAEVESVDDLIQSKRFYVDVKEKSSTSLSLSLSTLTFLVMLIVAVLGIVYLSLQSFEISAEDREFVAKVESIPVPETDSIAVESSAGGGPRLPSPNSASEEALQLYELSFVKETSATLFFFNKSETFDFTWTGSADSELFDFLHLVVDSNPEPDFFGEFSISESIATGSESVTMFRIPTSTQGAVYARLCGFDNERRSCVVNSNIVQIRE